MPLGPEVMLPKW